MTRSAVEIIEAYLQHLRAELVASGAPDVDDLVDEIRSMLAEASNGSSQRATDEVARLGAPVDLARAILEERGLEPAHGIPSGVWWRLGLAAPIDIAIGVSVPLAATLPVAVIASFVEPRIAGIALAAVLGIAALAWPFFIWRPWRRGGQTLSPGMTFTGLAIVRTPGMWRLATLSELEAAGDAPRRRWGLAVAVTALAIVAMVSEVAIAVTWVQAGH